MEDEGKDGGRSKGNGHVECVVRKLVCGTELDVNEVDGGQRGRDEKDLHHGIVKRNVRCKEIEIAGGEHNGEQQLRLARDTCVVWEREYGMVWYGMVWYGMV